MKRRDCNCTDWKENIDKVNAAHFTAHARNPDTCKGYEGVPFKFCPWCARLLMDLVSPAENLRTHKLRHSDSSRYDEICTECGATDASGDVTLYDKCPGDLSGS